jgi:ribosome-binding protein aMBF1 (putative translation factor)
MDDFEKYLNKQLEDPAFKKEWDESQLEYDIMKMIVMARCEENLTQQQLAERSGVRQSNISRIENGSCVPSIVTLQALAKGLGKRLKIELV